MAEPGLDPQVAAATAVFDKDVGTWDATTEIRPSREGPVERSTGVATSRRACGGRWLLTDYRSDTGFEGHGVYGWDPARGKYVGTWVDNLRGFIAVSEGEWDSATRTMTFVTEATVGDRTLRWRETTETRDRDTQVFRSFMPGPDGREFELMTVTYRRRRGSGGRADPTPAR
jgi:hypothetical protein